MEKLAMCRMCLADDVPMRLMENKYLQSLFEKMTEIPFVREDRPVLACHICCARLQSCYKFRNNCLQSEELLKQMLNTNELTPANLRQWVSDKKFCIVEVANISCSEVDSDNTEAHVEGQTSVFYEVEVKEEIIEDSTEESLQEYVQDPEEQNTYYKTDWDAIRNDAQSIDGSEPHEIITVVKCEPTEIDIEYNDVQRSDTEVDTLDVHESSHDIPSKTFPAVLQKCDDASYEKLSPRQVSQKKNKLTEAKAERRSCDKETFYNYSNDACDLEDSVKSYITSCSSNTSNNIPASAGEKPFKCDKCCKCFTKKRYLVAHNCLPPGDKPYKCNDCEKCFAQMRYLIRHNRIHTGDRPFKCEICNKCFAEKSSLNKHIRIHTGDKPFKCNTCDMCFNLKSTLENHIRIHTGDQPFECNICNKTFKQKASLKSHIHTHTSVKTYKCNICYTVFNEKNDLHTHSCIHRVDKPHKCNTCNKSFTLSKDLIRHYRTHTGDKPYKCNICNKCFTQSFDLTRHNRIHTGVKPHKCKVCNKCFTQKSYLDRHILIHTGDKPYKCNVCDKTFNQKGNLDTHYRIHT